MFNVKWAAFPAGAAFLLAFLLSLLLGQVGLGLAMLRAVVFALLFFGIGCGAWVLISTYVPELLIPETNKSTGDGVFPTDFSAEPSAPRVNITLDDSTDAALPGDTYGIDGIGNIADLVSRPSDLDMGIGTRAETDTVAGNAGDIDQGLANGYTTERDGGNFAPASNVAPTVEASGLGDFSSFFDGLTAKGVMGDFDDSFTDLFQPLPGNEVASSEEKPLMERKSTEGKALEMKGDFSPKEIALGLRTVLAKEKRG